LEWPRTVTENCTPPTRPTTLNRTIIPFEVDAASSAPPSQLTGTREKRTSSCLTYYTCGGQRNLKNTLKVVNVGKHTLWLVCLLLRKMGLWDSCHHLIIFKSTRKSNGVDELVLRQPSLACAALTVNTHEGKQKWPRKDLACPSIRPPFGRNSCFVRCSWLPCPLTFRVSILPGARCTK
jgi:hypothetical protein